MPTYEYLCQDCEHNFEQVQKITEDSLKTCPKCGKDTLRRVMNATAFHLKGSGWYKTDYASGSSGGSSSSSSSNSTSSSKVESASSSTSATTDSGNTEKKPSETAPSSGTSD